jgi:hypothetical protein
MGCFIQEEYMNLTEVITQINNDKFPTLETIINHIINSKTVKHGLFIVDFLNEEVKSILRYENNNSYYEKFDILVAKKDKDWNISIASEEQKTEFFKRIKDIDQNAFL